MATVKGMVSLEEYLGLTFDGPDREFVDGEILERNMGDNLHGKIQWVLSGLFYRLSEKYPLHGRTETRLQLGPTRYRIPDLCVFAGAEPTESIPSTLPLIVIEIVSPDDRYTDILGKLEEYRNWGVPHIWLVDPRLRKLYVFSTAGLSEVSAFDIPEFRVQVLASEIFR